MPRLIARNIASLVPRIAAVLCFALLAAATTTEVRAQSVAQTLRDFGIIGEWQNDCDAGISSDNYLTIFSVQRSRVLRTQYAKANVKYNEFEIVDARTIGNNQLYYVMAALDGAGNRYEITIIRRTDSFRYLQSKVQGMGAYMIKDGKFVDSGADSAWSYKCN